MGPDLEINSILFYSILLLVVYGTYSGWTVVTYKTTQIPTKSTKIDNILYMYMEYSSSITRIFGSPILFTWLE